jgi:hypothetical protein
LPADIPHWSENFALAGFDPAIGVHLFFHIGRWRKDWALWREVVGIALPDGTVVAHRGIGDARASARGPGGPNFAVEVVEPGRNLRWRFLGGARRVPATALAEGLLPEGPLERLAFELEFVSNLPVWNLAKAGHKTDFMGRGHVEQPGRVTGRISVGDSHFQFDSTLNRDHSRGPRDFAQNARHIWMHGVFENGVIFMAYEAEVVGRDGAAFSECCVYNRGIRYDGRLTLGYRIPFTNNLDAMHEPVPMAIDYPGGRFNIVAESFPAISYYQATAPNDLYVGVRQTGGLQNTFCIEQAVRYRMGDGVAGYGHMERLVPGSIIVEEA